MKLESGRFPNDPKTDNLLTTGRRLLARQPDHHFPISVHACAAISFQGRPLPGVAVADTLFRKSSSKLKYLGTGSGTGENC